MNSRQTISVPHPSRMFGTLRLLKGLRAVMLGPAAARRRVLHEVARVMAEKLGGHYVGDDYKLWLLDADFVSRFKEMSPHNFFSMERKYALREFARHVKNLRGDLAECGSYVGVSSWFIAAEARGVDFYLFDSFEGLSTPTSEDKSTEGVQQWEEGDLSVSEDVIRQRLSGFDNIHIMKGWIPDRFPEVSDRVFKLVHIDVDLYEPTLASLEFFYERMTPGGVIVMDDYGFENCPGAYAAANEYMAGRPEVIIHLPTGQGVVVKSC